MERKEICCLKCKTKLTDSCQICPECGSESKIITLRLSEALDIHTQMKGKVTEDGGNRRRASEEIKVGDDFYRDQNKWVHLERIFDRKNDSYIERITDPETGKIIREIQEPLSGHRGHGDAKFVSRKKDR
jgi:hypothetical protein